MWWGVCVCVCVFICCWLLLWDLCIISIWCMHVCVCESGHIYYKYIVGMCCNAPFILPPLILSLSLSIPPSLSPSLSLPHTLSLSPPSLSPPPLSPDMLLVLLSVVLQLWLLLSSLLVSSVVSVVSELTELLMNVLTFQTVAVLHSYCESRLVCGWVIIGCGFV